MAKEGSTVSGLMDSFATTVSVALQYGVPLRDLVNKFAHVRFEPSGFTGNQEIPIAKSIVDYIFRWLGSRFLSRTTRPNLGLIDRSAIVADAPAVLPGLRYGRLAVAAPAGYRPPRRLPLRRKLTATRSARGPGRPADGHGRRRQHGRRKAADPVAEPLAVIATNGHWPTCNGHANGNGNGRQATERRRPARSP